MKIRGMYCTNWRHVFAVEMLDGQMMAFNGTTERMITERDLKPLPEGLEVSDEYHFWENFGFKKEETISDFQTQLGYIVKFCQYSCDNVQELFPEMLATDTGRKWARDTVLECKKILDSFGGVK